MAEIKVEDLSKIYSDGTPFKKVALEDINLTIPSGQMIAVLGHTGSGKSTLIQHLNALIEPTKGKVLFDGRDINESKLSRKDVKKHVGIVFQYPEYQLFEETVYADIAFGPKNMGLDGSQVDEAVRAAAKVAGVDESLFDQSPLELSGGQKRRIAIAGVMAMKPEILILDEPTAGLDPQGCRDLIANIISYKEKTGSTVIMVSHNMDLAAEIADRLIVLADGKIAMDGTPEEVFSKPEKLKEIGLKVPAATEIASLIGLKDSVYTHAQLLDAIKREKEEK